MSILEFRPPCLVLFRGQTKSIFDFLKREKSFLCPKKIIYIFGRCRSITLSLKKNLSFILDNGFGGRRTSDLEIRPLARGRRVVTSFFGKESFSRESVSQKMPRCYGSIEFSNAL